MLRYRSEVFHTWTEGEIAQFERYWPQGSKQGLAFNLLLRSGAVRQMNRQQVQGGRVAVR